MLCDAPSTCSSPVSTSGVTVRADVCEEPLVKTEASSSPTDTVGDFSQTPQILPNQLPPQQLSSQTAGHFCGFGSPGAAQIELGGCYPLLNTSADIKWYSDFGCSGANSMGPQGNQGSEKLLVASSPPATSSEKSLPSFQDSSPYVAYTK